MPLRCLHLTGEAVGSGQRLMSKCHIERQRARRQTVLPAAPGVEDRRLRAPED